MAQLDTRPGGIDVRFRPGSIVTLNLTGPAGWLSARTFTATLDGETLSVSEVGDTLVVTVSSAITSELDENGQSYNFVLTETGEDVALIGRWTPSLRASSSQSVDAVVLIDSLEVGVSVILGTTGIVAAVQAEVDALDVRLTAVEADDAGDDTAIALVAADLAAEAVTREAADDALQAELDATQAALPGTYVTGQVGPDDPDDTLPPGTEFVWFQTDGEGNLLDILSGVTA